MAVGVRSGRSEQLEALVWGVMGNIAIHVFHHQEEFLAVEDQPQSVCRVEEVHSSPFFWKKSFHLASFTKVFWLSFYLFGHPVSVSFVSLKILGAPQASVLDLLFVFLPVEFFPKVITPIPIATITVFNSTDALSVSA